MEIQGMIHFGIIFPHIPGFRQEPLPEPVCDCKDCPCPRRQYYPPAAVVTILDRVIAVYANKDGGTIDAAKADGLILIAAKNAAVPGIRARPQSGRLAPRRALQPILSRQALQIHSVL